MRKLTPTQLVEAVALMAPSEMAEARRLATGRDGSQDGLADRPTRTPSADPEPDDGGLRHLSESGVPINGKAPEPVNTDFFDRMTPAARTVWWQDHGLPHRGGSYSTVVNGKSVQVGLSDTDTLQTCSDLYQMIPHEYAGSPSIDATRLESMIQNLQAGKPLNATEWQVFRDLEIRYGSQLATWRANGRDGQDARLPQNSGRVSEAGVLALFDHAVPMREASSGWQTVVQRLSDAVPAGHADRSTVDRLKANGAVHTHEDRARISELAGRWLPGKSQSDAESADDLLNAIGAPLTEADSLQDFAQVHGMDLREAADAADAAGLLSSSEAASSPLDALAEAGVKLKAAR
jgi:hypothetical protein